MSKDATEIRSYGDGGMYLATVGTAFPAAISEEIDLDDWNHLGYTTPAGLEPTFGREEKDIDAWQSLDPVKQLLTKLPKSIKGEFLQTNGDLVLAALGGGTIEEGDPGEFIYHPPAIGHIEEYAIILEGIEDEFKFRICYVRGKQQGEVKLPFLRDDACSIALDMKILAATDGGESFQVQTNAPGFTATGS